MCNLLLLMMLLITITTTTTTTTTTATTDVGLTTLLALQSSPVVPLFFLDFSGFLQDFIF